MRSGQHHSCPAVERSKVKDVPVQDEKSSVESFVISFFLSFSRKLKCQSQQVNPPLEEEQEEQEELFLIKVCI